MSFYDEYLQLKNIDFNNFFDSVTESHIKSVINKIKLTPEDFLVLLSPHAEKFIEAVAQKAHQLTIQNFGKTILFFTPLYVANYCTNQCIYCGFNTQNQLKRKQLTLEEVEAEAKAIAATGLRHILLLTGDAKHISSVGYIQDCVGVLKKYFPSIGIEIYALEELEYAQLVNAGVDSMTMFQETYNEQLYDQLHLKGPKKDYRFRLDAPERAAKAGMRSINLGALLGLDNWRKEAFFTGMHANYLQDKYPDAEIAISLPRIRPNLGGYQPKQIVSDKNLVQFMLAFRHFMPRGGITISTRENAEFRDKLLQLGVTRMSAGVSTVVGGHTSNDDEGQFEISDQRDVEQMREALSKRGYQPVFKDWQQF